MKTSLSKGKGRSLVKHTNVSQLEESSIAPTAMKDMQEGINRIANGEKHVRELQSTSQVNSKSLKEQVLTQHQSQITPTNHETTPETPTNQILTQEIGMKRKLEEQEDEVKAKKSKEDVDNDEADEPT